MTFSELTPELLRRARVHNHPRVNNRLGHDYNSFLNNTLNLRDCSHSTLFLRKVKTTDAVGKAKLLISWREMVLGLPQDDSSGISSGIDTTPAGTSAVITMAACTGSAGSCTVATASDEAHAEVATGKKRKFSDVGEDELQEVSKKA